MESVIQQQKIEENNIDKKKKTLKITIWRLFAYFIIYSIIGLIIETVFGIFTKGVIESRKSFVYGPFCAIYGLGASCMIAILKPFEKNNASVFIGGILVGTVTEYLVSFFGEIMLHVKWWDYSNLPLNINGRVCLLYSAIWGFLALLLLKIVNPYIDKIINFFKNKFTPKVGKIIISTSILLLLLDWIVSTLIVGAFLVRTIHNYDLKVENRANIEIAYNMIYNNKAMKEFIYNHYGDARMIRTFPNMKVEDINGKMIYFKDLMPHIQPYYVKIFDTEMFKYLEEEE